MEKKLTAEQIVVIEGTLVLNGLKFEDLKLELTDHIASEIEELLNTNILSFEENAEIVFEKWSQQLRPRFSILVGFTNPRIMTQKCHKIVKKQIFTVIGFATLISILLLLCFRNSEYEVMIAKYQIFIKALSIAEFCLIILASILIWKSKHQTTYSYLIKKKVFGIFIFLLLIIIGIFPIPLNNPDLKLVFVSNLSVIAYIVIAGFYLQLAYKHLQFERKLANI